MYMAKNPSYELVINLVWMYFKDSFKKKNFVPLVVFDDITLHFFTPYDDIKLQKMI